MTEHTPEDIAAALAYLDAKKNKEEKLKKKKGGQGKQAKVLTKRQINEVISYLNKSSRRYKERDIVMFLLSVRAGLRAKEISCITWSMVTDADGKLSDSIALENVASKGQSGRTIPINEELYDALLELHTKDDPDPCEFIIKSQKGGKMKSRTVVDWFKDLYVGKKLHGCTSHSGRRTSITDWAENCIRHGGSIANVMRLAGHSNLGTTQRYIEVKEEVNRLIVGARIKSKASEEE